MEEKVLIRSEMGNLKLLFLIFVAFGLVLSLIYPTIEIIDDEDYEKWWFSSHEHYRECYLEEYQSSFFEDRENGNLQSWKADCRFIKQPNHFIRAFVDFWYVYADATDIIIYFSPLFVFIIIGAIVCFGLHNVKLTVTNKRVYGSVTFGKRVDIPIDSVSAVGTSWMKGIAVSSSSGKISFLMIKNRDEIHKCLSDILINRQNHQTASFVKQDVNLSDADELKKYKDLLDSGIITQEEFDAKKKQLLGL